MPEKHEATIPQPPWSGFQSFAALLALGFLVLAGVDSGRGDWFRVVADVVAFLGITLALPSRK